MRSRSSDEPAKLIQSVTIVGGHSHMFCTALDGLSEIVAFMNRYRNLPGIIWHVPKGQFTGSIEAGAKVIMLADNDYLQSRVINPHTSHPAFGSIHQLIATDKYFYTEENDVLVKKEKKRNGAS